MLLGYNFTNNKGQLKQEMQIEFRFKKYISKVSIKLKKKNNIYIKKLEESQIFEIFSMIISFSWWHGRNLQRNK